MKRIDTRTHVHDPVKSEPFPISPRIPVPTLSPVASSWFLKCSFCWNLARLPFTTKSNPSTSHISGLKFRTSRPSALCCRGSFVLMIWSRIWLRSGRRTRKGGGWGRRARVRALANWLWFQVSLFRQRFRCTPLVNAAAPNSSRDLTERHGEWRLKIERASDTVHLHLYGFVRCYNVK